MNGREQRAARTPSRQARKDAAQWLGAQVALDRAGFSSGEIDGRSGSNTTRALEGFQQARRIAVSGRLDRETIAALGDAFDSPTLAYAVTEEDVAGPFIAAMPDDMMKLAELEALGYTSALERLAERFHAQPALLTRLNGGARPTAGTTFTVPNVEPFYPPAERKAPVPQLAANAARVLVSEATRTVRVEQADGTIVFQAPISYGSAQDPLPKGEWSITGTAVLPVFHYNPELFWDADAAHAKAKIAPGPNNPVGVIWIDLEKEHLGLHGTPEPSTIGRAQTHGCVRLTNWDALRLGTLVGRGARVLVQ